MPNMSYCRYRNTLLALQDCADFIIGNEAEEDDLSEEESLAKAKIIELCCEIAKYKGEIDEDDFLVFS